MQVKWSKKALTALDSAIDYGYKTFGEKATTEFYLRIKKHEVYLQDNPNIGSPEQLLSERKSDYRSIVVHKHYKMVYHITRDTVWISDLWDTRREPQKLTKRIK